MGELQPSHIVPGGSLVRPCHLQGRIACLLKNNSGGDGIPEYRTGGKCASRTAHHELRAITPTESQIRPASSSLSQIRGGTAKTEHRKGLRAREAA